MGNRCCCGKKQKVIQEPIYLLNEVSKQPVPLKQIQVEAHLVQSIIKSTITQHYYNPSGEVIQTIFIFPINDDFCIHKLTVHFSNGETLETIVDERGKVLKMYKEAVDSGKFAVKGIFPCTGDLFCIRIGGFPPLQSLVVQIEILQQLKLDDLSYCFRFPMKYVPRYISNYEFSESLKQFPLAKSSNGPYTWELKITIETLGELLRVQSKNHQIKFEQTAVNQGIITLNEIEKLSAPNKDFVLLVSDQNFGEASLMFGSSQKDTGFIINVFADIRSMQMKEQVQNMVSKSGVVWSQDYVQDHNNVKNEEAAPFETVRCEYIFLLHRNYSMSEQNFNLTIEALKLFLYSLPAGCLFNVYYFTLFPEQIYENSALYNDDSLNNALKKVDKYADDLGGTSNLDDFLLEKIFENKPKPVFTQQIFLLTDGYIYNDESFLEDIKKYSGPQLRVHAFGIGSEGQTEFIQYAAFYGGGMQYFIDNLADIAKNVTDTLCRTLIPYLVIKKVTLLDQDDYQCYEKELEILIPNGKLFAYSDIILNESIEISKASVSIYTPTQNKIKMYQPLASKQLSDAVFKVCVSNYLKLANLDQPKIVSLSIKHQVICKATAFYGEKKCLISRLKKKRYYKYH